MSLTLERIYQHPAGPVKTLTSNTYPEICLPKSLHGAGAGGTAGCGTGAGSGADGADSSDAGAGSGAGGADSSDAGVGSGDTGAAGGVAGPGTIVENHWLRALLLKVWSLDRRGIHVRNVDCQPYPSHTRPLKDLYAH